MNEVEVRALLRLATYPEWKIFTDKFLSEIEKQTITNLKNITDHGTMCQLTGKLQVIDKITTLTDSMKSKLKGISDG
jgi:hypothetical protein